MFDFPDFGPIILMGFIFAVLLVCVTPPCAMWLTWWLVAPRMDWLSPGWPEFWHILAPWSLLIIFLVVWSIFKPLGTKW